MSEDLITITYLTGETKFDPVKYTLTRNQDGSGTLESKFIKLSGDFDELRFHSTINGLSPTISNN